MRTQKGYIACVLALHQFFHKKNIEFSRVFISRTQNKCFKILSRIGIRCSIIAKSPTEKKFKSLNLLDNGYSELF